jgi:hypothetical protein
LFALNTGNDRRVNTKTKEIIKDDDLLAFFSLVVTINAPFKDELL